MAIPQQMLTSAAKKRTDISWSDRTAGHASWSDNVLPKAVDFIGRQTLDPSDPFATPFVLRNDGYFSVYEVKAACSIDITVGAGGIQMDNGVALTSIGLNTTEIVADGTWAFMCPAGWGNSVPITKSDLRIFISYSARLVPKRWTYKCFRYVTKADRDGKLHWFSVAAPEPCHWPTSIIEWAGQPKPTLPPELR
jgi:hypothetical protein